MEDTAELVARNEHFIAACRRGSWTQLRPILGADFRYLDGRTGNLWNQPSYISDLEANPAPSLAIDEVVVHVAGDTAVVSARTTATRACQPVSVRAAGRSGAVRARPRLAAAG